MNIYQSEIFRLQLIGLDDRHLEILRETYDGKGDEAKDELLLIDLEIERREKIRRCYEG